MSTDLPLLVGAGLVPEVRMREAAEALASLWALPLQTHPIGTSPAEVLNNQNSALVRLCGDPAEQLQGGGHWIEALADWRQPLLLLVPGDEGGRVSGNAAAYSALCHQMDAPLMGLIQIQGSWNPQERRRDGLAWCGWVPTTSHSNHLEELLRIHACLQQSELSQQLNLQARAAAPVRA